MIENTKDTTSLKERDKWVTERSSEDIREVTERSSEDIRE